MIQTAEKMECPRCGEIELRLVDEEMLDEPDAWVETYECECGHVECHTSGLPSWYRPEKWEGCSPQETATEGDDDE